MEHNTPCRGSKKKLRDYAAHATWKRWRLPKQIEITTLTKDMSYSPLVHIIKTCTSKLKLHPMILINIFFY